MQKKYCFKTTIIFDYSGMQIQSDYGKKNIKFLKTKYLIGTQGFYALKNDIKIHFSLRNECVRGLESVGKIIVQF